MLYNLSKAPPLSPSHGLPWGHALYMRPGVLTVAGRKRQMSLGALRRDLGRAEGAVGFATAEQALRAAETFLEVCK